jgi:uncharacterized Fe-S cluster-containing radical SAM superfamily enzyme
VFSLRETHWLWFGFSLDKTHGLGLFRKKDVLFHREVVVDESVVDCELSDDIINRADNMADVHGQVTLYEDLIICNISCFFCSCEDAKSRQRKQTSLDLEHAFCFE